jgi:hypothetical protein
MLELKVARHPVRVAVSSFKEKSWHNREWNGKVILMAFDQSETSLVEKKSQVLPALSLAMPLMLWQVDLRTLASNLEVVNLCLALLLSLILLQVPILLPFLESPLFLLFLVNQPQLLVSQWLLSHNMVFRNQ